MSLFVPLQLGWMGMVHHKRHRIVFLAQSLHFSGKLNPNCALGDSKRSRTHAPIGVNPDLEFHFFGEKPK